MGLQDQARNLQDQLTEDGYMNHKKISRISSTTLLIVIIRKSLGCQILHS